MDGRINDIQALANEISPLMRRSAQEGVAAYTPIVHDILSGRMNDLREIERCLDEMLGFCFDTEMLSLYKCVCRFLYPKHPELVYDLVMNYREMWDSDESEHEADRNNATACCTNSECWRLRKP